MADTYVIVNWHHGGKLVWGTPPKYVGGVCSVKQMDTDKFSVPELMWYIWSFGYVSVRGIYYKEREGGKFILLATDSIILDVVKHWKDGDILDFYVSHVVDVPIVNVSVSSGVNTNNSKVNDGVQIYIVMSQMMMILWWAM